MSSRLRWIIVVVAVFTSAALAAEDQPFRSGVERVRVDVLASHKGEPIVGLTGADFELFDNGVSRPVEVINSGQTVGVVVLVDVSYSALAFGSQERIPALVEAVLAAAAPRDRVALLSFGRGVRMIVPPTRDLAMVSEAARHVATLPVRRTEATALWDAVFYGAAIAREAGGRPLVAVITDGGDNASWLTPRQPSGAAWTKRAKARTIDALQGGGVAVDVIVRPLAGHTSEGLADDTYGDLLSGEIARTVGGEVHSAGSKSLKQDLAARFAALRAGYVLAFSTADSQRDGKWHPLQVRLRSRAGTVQARSGYFASTARGVR